jgi:outer membrane protein assembly factor BamE (lipoprotein component of BamABCDE complex)
MEQVAAARAAKKEVDLLPERTDMSKEQVRELMGTPIDEVVDMTKEELKDYSGSVDEIVTRINEEIDAGNECAVDEGAKAEGYTMDVARMALPPSASDASAQRKGRKKKSSEGK